MSAAPTTSSVSGQPDTLVYGFGSTGLSVARYLKRQQVPAVYVDSRDEPPGLQELRQIEPSARIVAGELSRDLLRDISTVIVSPGIADSDEFLQDVRAADIAVISDIDIFVRRAAVDFVAVTGSNGKSTVTTLIALMCEAAGLRVLAGANLGTPALDLLAERVPDIYVLELSSFQLQRTAQLPAKIAVLLNVSPDHLDWHDSEAEYVAAKYRIFAQAKAAVFNRDDDAVQRIPRDLCSRSFGLGAPAEGEYGIVEYDGRRCLSRGDEVLLDVSELALVGRHNQANALAALAAVELMDVDLESALTVLRDFRGLPHRMQFVATVDDVAYVNDSKATNVAAAIAAVCSLSSGIVLLAGGQGKGGDFVALARGTADRLVAVVAFGQDAPLIESAYRDRVAVHVAEDLEHAVECAAAAARAGDTVLLAPACASFDQFDNYQARGRAFVELVEGLAA